MRQKPDPWSFCRDAYTPQIKSPSTLTQTNPATHSPLATYTNATAADVQAAIEAALAARKSWASTSFEDRASIFLKAANLISKKYRYEIMALTMHGQGKNAWQAEIDAAAELCDFFRWVSVWKYMWSFLARMLIRVQIRRQIR